MRLRRFGWTAAVSAILGANIWLCASRFVPILRDGRVSYRFLAAPAATLAVAIAGSVLGLIGLHALLVRYLFRPVDGRSAPGDASDRSYLAPLALLAVNLSALAGLVPALNGHLFPWLYLTVDLRPWITACVLCLFFLEVDRRSHNALRARLQHWAGLLARGEPRAALETTIVVVAVAFACLSSPALRFDVGLHGDEPKYLRYCESLYQGHGLDVSNLRAIDELPLDRPSALLRNITAGLALIPHEWPHIRQDVGRLIDGDLQQRFNRAKYLGGFFVEGRDGGVYQAHGPGLSMLLMPGYYLDRQLLGWQSAAYARGEPAYIFPERLLFTNIVQLLLYAFLGVALFRFLLSLQVGRILNGKTHPTLGEQGVSFGLAIAALATMPISAFAFQFYPEIAAALIVTIVARRLLFERDMTAVSAVLTGFAVGYLPWLHVRYLAIMGILLAWGAVTAGRTMQRRLAFLIGSGLSLVAYCFYAYYATGSFLPTAFYDAGGSMLRLASVGPGLFAFAFDGTFGLVAHAPVLLISLLGFPALVARQPKTALLCGLLIVAAFATAAAKDFTAALGSPGRFVVVVMPLFWAPFAEAIRRFRHSQLFRVSCGLALILSLQTAWAYNRSHLKHIGQMMDSGFSGWKLNLLFPEFRGHNWDEDGFQSPLLAVWIVVAAAAVVVPYLVGRRAQQARPAASLSLTATAVFASVALAATILSRFSDRQIEPTHLMREADASAAADAYLRETAPWFELAASQEGITWPPNEPPQELTLAVSREPRAAGEPLLFRLDAGTNIVFKLTARHEHEWRERGVLTVDYGDGTPVEPVAFVSEITLTHRYDKPGRYQASMNVLAARQWTSARAEVRVSEPAADPADAEPIDVATIDGLPPEVSAAPPTLRISRLAVEEGRLCVESVPMAPRTTGLGQAQVWVVTNSQGRWTGQNYGTLSSPEGCVQVPTGREGSGALRRPDPLNTGIMLVYPGSPFGGAQPERSQLTIIWWPSREALIGAPIVFHPGVKSFWDETASR